MGMTQSLLLTYTYPDLKNHVDRLETQNTSEILYHLTTHKEEKERDAICTFIIEKAITSPDLMDKHIELIRRIDDEKFYSILSAVLEKKLLKIIEGFQDEHLDDNRVVQRGRDIAVFTGKMINLGLLSDKFTKALFDKLKHKATKRSNFFMHEITKTTDDFERNIRNAIRSLIDDETKLKNFVKNQQHPTITTANYEKVFNNEILKIIQTHSKCIGDIKEFSHLGHVLAVLFNAHIILGTQIDPWFKIAKSNDLTFAAFIIRLNEVSHFMGHSEVWMRTKGIFHVPIEAQDAMNELLKFRDEKVERDLEG
jgi:hypothetical protein